jgi:hypothetical protein
VNETAQQNSVLESLQNCKASETVVDASRFDIAPEGAKFSLIQWIANSQAFWE